MLQSLKSFKLYSFNPVQPSDAYVANPHLVHALAPSPEGAWHLAGLKDSPPENFQFTESAFDEFEGIEVVVNKSPEVVNGVLARKYRLEFFDIPSIGAEGFIIHIWNLIKKPKADPEMPSISDLIWVLTEREIGEILISMQYRGSQSAFDRRFGIPSGIVDETSAIFDPTVIVLRFNQMINNQPVSP